MDTTLLAMEKENKRTGMRNSIILHLLLLLLFWFIKAPEPVPEVPVIEVAIQFEESKLIDFAKEDSNNSRKAKDNEGKTRAKTEEVKQVKTTPTEVKPETKVTPPTPTPPTPVKDVTPTEPMVSEVLEEESPVEAIEEEMEFDEPEEEVIPEPEVVEEEPTKPSKPAFESSAPSSNTSDSKTGTDKPSSIDGDGGNGKGDQGEGAGADEGDDGDSGIGTEGAGNGEYDGSGNGVFGRKVIYRNHAELAAVTASGSGRIYVKVCINRAGKATYTEIDNFNTTITNKATLRKALEMIKGYKFEPDRTAPKEQCGMIKLFLDVNAFK